MLELNKIYNLDCMEGMQQIPDKFFELAIVDPPYFNGPETRGYYGAKESSKGVARIDYPVINKWQIPDEDYFKELERVSKNQIIWGCNYFKYQFGPGRIIWDKVNYDSSFSDCEIAYCSLHDSVRMFRYMWNGMLQGKSIKEGHLSQGNKKLNEKRIHPTQKPVNLYKWLLQKYANRDFKILDTHIGSASIVIACIELGIDYVGFELDNTHYMRAMQRVNEYVKNQQANPKLQFA